MVEGGDDAGPASERTTVRRGDRGVYDPDLIRTILDEALVCHVGIVEDGTPFVLPTIHARVDDVLYLHGAPRSRLLKIPRGGPPVCVTATVVDSLVLARSVFHHSMNYRSVVVLGTPREVVDTGEKLRALEAVTEHVAPGRWAHARRPNTREFARTAVIALDLGEASAKVRGGPPIDDEEDYALDLWAGEIPLRTVSLPAVDDPRLATEAERPGYADRFERPGITPA